jgi:putative ABC transport system substrate-binding protein
MRKEIFSFPLGAMLFALCAAAEAQQTTKVSRIGYLSTLSLSAMADRIEAFRQGLRELGSLDSRRGKAKDAIFDCSL